MSQCVFNVLTCHIRFDEVIERVVVWQWMFDIRSIGYKLAAVFMGDLTNYDGNPRNYGAPCTSCDLQSAINYNEDARTEKG